MVHRSSMTIAPHANSGANSYLVEAPGEPPHIIQLNARLATFLERLAEAGPNGLTGSGRKFSALVCDLRAAGVQIACSRIPKPHGELGHLLRITLCNDVSRAQGGYPNG